MSEMSFMSRKNKVCIPITNARKYTKMNDFVKVVNSRVQQNGLACIYI